MADEKETKTTSQAEQAEQPQEVSASNTPAQPAKTSGLAIAGLVTGGVALVGSWVPILNNFSAFIAVLGAILAIIGLVSVSRSKGAKKGKGLAFAALIISVVAFAVVLYTQSVYSAAINTASESYNESLDRSSGRATEQILGKDVTVDFGAYEIKSETTGSYTSKDGYLAVTVTNQLSETKSYTVHLEALDANGTRVRDDYVYANNLAAGQSIVENCFESYSEEEVNKNNSYTFKIVEVQQY